MFSFYAKKYIVLSFVPYYGIKKNYTVEFHRHFVLMVQKRINDKTKWLLPRLAATSSRSVDIILSPPPLFSRTRGCPKFNITGREPSEETLNFSVGFNTFVRVFPGSYGEFVISILTVVFCVVITTNIFPLENLKAYTSASTCLST